MDGTAQELWQDLNQRHVGVALAGLKATLQGAIAAAAPTGEGGGLVGERDALEDIARAMPAPPALDVLTAAFELSPFERNLLTLCAGVELDASFARLCAEAQGEPRRPCVTFGLALAALPNPHWSALSPAAPLRHWRLIDLVPGETLTGSTLRIDERILHHLAGLDAFDGRLSGVETCVPGAPLPASQAALAEAASRAWRCAADPRSPPAIQLCGEDAVTRRAVATWATARSGMQLRRVRADALPQGPAELDTFLLLWAREVLLGAGALLLECDDESGETGAAGRESTIAQVVERVQGAFIIGTRNRRPSAGRPMIDLGLMRPTRDEQRALWHGVLRESCLPSNDSVDALVAQFRLGHSAIQAAVRQATVSLGTDGGDGGAGPVASPALIGAALWDAARAQARTRLDGLAQPIEAAASWADLVLPEPQLELLRDIATQVRHRTKVYDAWGFSRKGTRGLGISALFAGQSGTGKTVAAEVMARDLRLDLHRVDLSQVVSKYIGETEKNLRRVFDAAEAGGAILLFDEADALFGKRSEVRDSHDRYANIEVSYLLQRMEAYHGLAILTTNMKSALDTAFLRRIRFVVQFPFPDAVQREEIWRRIFPPETPTEGLRPEVLARLNVAGGNIRNIALGAAFLAAAERLPVRMTHLLRAACNECLKIEKTVADSELKGWV